MDIACDDHLNSIASLFSDSVTDIEAIKNSIRDILKAIGEDPEREGLKDTPARVARSYDELLAGYRTDPRKLINSALFDVKYDGMVIVRKIEF